MPQTTETHNIQASRRAYPFLLGFVLLTAVCALAGWTGTLIAVPPNYDILIWPNAGVAFATLLLFGRRYWPGVFLASLLVSLWIGGTVTDFPFTTNLLLSSGIALAETLQAVVATMLAQAFFGKPVRLTSWRAALGFAIIVGPIASMVTPTIGGAVLYLVGFFDGLSFPSFWLNWWRGSTFGAFVFAPIILFGPWRGRNEIYWQELPVPRMNTMALTCVLLSLGASFYSWVTVSTLSYDRNMTTFGTLAEENARSLQSQLQSYRRSLDAGAAVVSASQEVTPDEWSTFVSALDIEDSLPGIAAIGLIVPVQRDQLPDFTAEMIELAGPDFAIHPETSGSELFIIKFAGPPSPQNKAAIGLDLTFEPIRYSAAVKARDTGRPVISSPIPFVHDEGQRMGFVLLRPVFAEGSIPATVEARRQALLGWVFAPFVSEVFFDGLTEGQNDRFHFSISTGGATPGTLIYSNAPADGSVAASDYHITKTLSVFGQNWTATWASTPAFDTNTGRNEPFLVLLVGLSLTLLIGILLTALVRRTEIVHGLVAQKTRQLRTNEEQTRSIIDTAVVGIMLLDKEGRILSLNRAAAPIFGYSSSQLVGMPLQELLPTLPADSLYSEKQPDKASVASLRLETKNSSGKKLFVEIQLNPWETEEGERRLTAIIRDVTKHQENELRLRDTEQRWNLALTAAKIAVFDVDLKAQTMLVSGTWMDQMGFARDADIDTRAEWLARVHPGDKPMVDLADKACIDGHSERSISEYRVRVADGSWRWIRSEAIVPERTPDGKALRLLGAQTDITELRNALEALRISERQFRSLIEHAPVGMALVNKDEELISVNKALCNFVGYSEAYLRGKKQYEITGKDNGAANHAQLRRLQKGEVPSCQYEQPFIRKDGKQVWGLINLSLAEQQYGEDVRYIVQVQDITDRKEVDQIKTNFVATVSHELRTPLTSIKGAMGLVLGSMSTDIPDAAHRLLKIAQNNTDRLILLVNDILDMEKISAGKSRFTMVDHDIIALLEQSARTNQPYAAEHGVRLVTRFASREAHAVIDADRFQQVMSNLLSNAAKFSPKGADVRIGCDVTGKHLRITVTDNGSGIPEHFRDRIFKPFSQADSSSTREKGGTGLGLNISKQIVERMGGTLGFDSIPGVETTFWIKLPLSRSDAQAGPGPNGKPQPGARANKAPEILHVEDDLDFAEVLKTAFGDQANVTIATSIKEAQDCLESQAFDLVIIDWELPDGHGANLLQTTTNRQPGVPIIGLTAQDTSVSDPRVQENIIKSRSQMETIVRNCLELIPST
ncbi:PAS domain S-box protein [Actibacterium sp. D379-3]